MDNRESARAELELFDAKAREAMAPKVNPFAYFDEYNARKVCSTPEDGEAHTARVKAVAPEWFKLEMGFTFMYGNDPAIVLGPGGHRDVDGSLHLKFMPLGFLIAYHYKGEWHIGDISEDWDGWNTVRPMGT